MGFDFFATRGTSQYLKDHGIPNKAVKKIAEGHPHVVDHVKNRAIQLVINTPSGKESMGGSHKIRRAVLRHGLPYATTLACARAMASGIEALIKRKLAVRSLQEYLKEICSHHNSHTS
jgi:carbamoyl-phosphate synthase large subunit